MDFASELGQIRFCEDDWSILYAHIHCSQLVKKKQGCVQVMWKLSCIDPWADVLCLSWQCMRGVHYLHKSLC